LNHRPRKRFGQNFLHDPGVIARIVRAINPQPGDRLVEIGPGQGAITIALLEAAGELDAIELDRDLLEPLREKCAGLGELRLHSGDALRFDFRRLAGDGPPLRVTGNLPYNISTPLLFHLLDQADVIRDMHFMLQKEVVQRMAAGPGGRDYGRLSVMVQVRCEVESLFEIGPGAFNPPPKVDSALVRLTPRQLPELTPRDPGLLAQIVAQAFSQRRKTLRNTLKPLLPAERIEAAGLDPTQRPEQISPAQYVALADLAGDLG
jgi:16S rRNA (adenine1518-N6/adenine1519-N6)-dimethyltransferase